MRKPLTVPAQPFSDPGYDNIEFLGQVTSFAIILFLFHLFVSLCVSEAIQIEMTLEDARCMTGIPPFWQGF